MWRLRQSTTFLADVAEFNALDTLDREIRSIFAFSYLEDSGYWDGGILLDEFEGSRFISDALRGPFFACVDAVDVVEWPHSHSLRKGRRGECPCGLWFLARHISLGFEAKEHIIYIGGILEGSLSI